MATQGITIPKAGLDDIIGIVKHVERELSAGLNVNDPAALAALAQKIQRDLLPRIHPERWYTLAEIDKSGIGPKKGRLYKAYPHLIRKEGRKSYVLGRDLLVLRDGAPTLAASTGAMPFPQPPRRRGRPRKAAASEADDETPGNE